MAHESSSEHREHDHEHGTVDPAIFSTKQGIRAVKSSLVGMLATAVVQSVIVLATGSVALLADTIHNFGDAGTAIPLWIAFALVRRAPSPRFTYGYGRVEDLAGVAIILTMLGSALAVGYVSIEGLLRPHGLEYVWAVMLGSLAGFLGNEAVAFYRVRVGKEIGSAALVADGNHANADGLTSLAVLVGAIGVQLGYPLADPLMGLLITVLIVRITWTSSRSVFARLLDGVDPEVSAEVAKAASGVDRVLGVTGVRVRWLGHRLHAEVNIAVSPDLSVVEAHEIATEVHHRLLHALRYLSDATIHIDPANASRDAYHRVPEHAHGDLPPHSH